MAETVVIFLPLPCQSHLNQLLRLAAAVAARGLPVHYLGTATHNRQARHRYPNQIPPSIQFHDLPSPPIPAVDPDPYAADKTPLHLSAAAAAYMSLQQPLAAFVTAVLSSTPRRRAVVIYDRMLAETARPAVLVSGADGYAFNCLSAFNLFHILWEVAGKPFQVPGAALPDLPPMEVLIPGAAALGFMASRSIQERAGDIHNTIRLIDADYIDLFSREEISGKDKEQWALWPIVTVRDGSHPAVGNHCLEWLDRQPPRSVIYVSFGTTVSLTEEEAGEIAAGLELSGRRFLWVLRDADGSDIFSGGRRRIGLPEGFEERVSGRGLVVREWAAQVEILGHGATAGFVTHCGWNSCLESLAAGVAVVAWPMHSDQPLNAMFLTEVLKMGIPVKDLEKREEPVTAEMVGRAVERLMGSPEGDAIRRRAAEVGGAVRKAAEEGGEVWLEMERFIRHIRR
ncbi:zeatin O-glucosyltransferase-like [Andrographis paniculata]|uniref:zeatin O-glucosyltransferase-like n=1 Tax=Andrographis paniculata TaxID=175694 RepID=UPI0021E76403|nr:zeatin O-glucosyltransferase-like [Andrographis paniculata]